MHTPSFGGAEMASALTTGRSFARALLATFEAHRDRTAVDEGASAHTYGELLGRSWRLAAVLRGLGLPPGAVVAVSAGRGYDYVASIVGAIFAGHPFLPVDPSYPGDHVAFLLKDAGAACLLVDAARPPWEPPEGVAVVCVREVGGAGEAPGAEVGAEGQDEIYTIYTSGTTGRPKGVPIEAGGLGAFLRSQGEYLQVSTESRFAALSSISFDMSIFEIFMALWHGASVCAVPREAAIDGRLLARELTRRGVTHALMTPSTLSMLPAAECPGLRHVVSAGEKCGAALVEAWSRGRAFYDAYGATEATIYTTITRKTPATPPGEVGRPMPGSRVVILDDEGVELGPEREGEICILGAAVSPGYRRRPELNAQKFLEREGVRLYRTADVGFVDRGGSLYFKGRKDKQVKWRGYRIELEEIEAVANETKLVAASHAALLRAGEPTASLVLFVAPGRAAPYSPDALRGELRRRLPGHMLPSRLVEVETMPTTANGKVNSELLLSTLTRG
jgi:amino acid adenylation domain-containing protein